MKVPKGRKIGLKKRLYAQIRALHRKCERGNAAHYAVRFMPKDWDFLEATT